ncbi:hypothetical protein [Aureimonas jatrophae]|uniref:O-antigen ligase n=1 Tax=Aureimonas jatrophae TaxID=1166073 RepID=A0A1H0NBY2_9HYPH|nr:hypothetical protein [Aureimonas jatrophae]MBB3951191.1 hypothetical protein [Aureimonas jatrophae]SDO90143.1 hypothetical protein SAMN05192530_1198 [Aureimonas jatrophae]
MSLAIRHAPRSSRLQRPADTTHVLRTYLDGYILVTSLFATFFFDLRGTAEIASLGSTAIWADDLVTLGLGPLIVFCLGARNRLPLAISLFMGIYAIALLRGLAIDPLKTFLGFRLDTVFFALMLSVMTGGIERLGYRRVVQIFTGFGMAVCALSLLRNVFGFELFAATEWTTIPGVLYNDGRTVNAFSVLLLSIAVVLRICVRIETQPPGEHRFRFDAISTLFVLALLLSGQRTASIGLALALGFMLCNRYRGLTYVVVPLIVGTFLTLALTRTPIDASLIEGAAAQYGKGGTFTYRTLIWTGLLENISTWSTFDYLFGMPVGVRPSYYLFTSTHTRLWGGSIHSAYLGTIVNAGLIGSIILFSIYIWRTLVAYIGYVTYSPRRSRFSPELRLCLSMLVLVLGFSYEWRGLNGFAMGVIFALPYSRSTRVGRPPVRSHNGMAIPLQGRSNLA